MLVSFILVVLIAVLFLLCGFIVERRTDAGKESKTLIKIGIALIVLEIIAILALIESIIHLSTVGCN